MEIKPDPGYFGSRTRNVGWGILDVFDYKHSAVASYPDVRRTGYY
jgi:hypothetical protein